ncbi:LacI family DNA-binding transcriptional regulator [Jannaschia pohangensis]|uniref:LacI family transcriptional regulator n=1 Tax=Jannaschia pohangensis TaxID=390807 RepID=A0A1I3QCD6_9RHOB|nr:LacI family DNA-binding transcriptional regulator [Jannaschia pohangensis]SFJ31365.1 LacI family transcriptional regulator [Jannaschia pohangensis]
MDDSSDDLLRPTTKDLARVAGVSRATVDRVLNNREGVRQKTVDRVNAAIRDLGFVRNIAAANLAKSRRYRFLFILPRTGDLFLQELSDRIEEGAAAFANDAVSAELQRVDTNDPHILSQYLTDLSADRWDGVAIMAPQSPQLRDAVTRLLERGIQVLPFVANQEGTISDDFVGIDNKTAGATAGLLMGRFVGRSQGKILVVAETMNAQDSLERRHGFDMTLHRKFPNLRVLPSLETYGADSRAEAVLTTTIAHHPDILGVYILSSEARVPLRILQQLNMPDHVVQIVHERTASTVSALLDGSVDAIITQDPGHLARSALRRLKARCDGSEILASQERIRTEILLETNV